MNDVRIEIIQKPDKSELIMLLNSTKTTTNSSPFLDNLFTFTKYHALAYVDGELRGWLALIEVNPSMMVIYENHPLINFEISNFSLKQKIMEEVIIFLRKSGVPNLRTFVNVREEDLESFQNLEKLYFSVKMIKTHMHYCMWHILSNDDLNSQEIPNHVQISPLTLENKQDLLDCYNLIFTNSLDDFINSLGKEESKYWDYLGSNHLLESSAVLKHGQKIIGFIGTRDEGNYIEFGPVGILPEYRGQGLGKVLMNYAIQNLIAMERFKGYLEVGSRNQPALNLYKQYGFEVVAMKHGYLKRL